MHKSVLFSVARIIAQPLRILYTVWFGLFSLGSGSPSGLWFFCVVSSAVYGRCIPTVPSFTWAVRWPSRHCVGRNSALEACRFRQSFFVYSKRCCCDVSFFTAVVPSLSLSLLLPASVVPSGEAYSTVTSTQLIDQVSCDCLWSASVWPWLCSRPRFMCCYRYVTRWSSTAKATRRTTLCARSGSSTSRPPAETCFSTCSYR